MPESEGKKGRGKCSKDSESLREEKKSGRLGAAETSGELAE